MTIKIGEVTEFRAEWKPGVTYKMTGITLLTLEECDKFSKGKVVQIVYKENGEIDIIKTHYGIS